MDVFLCKLKENFITAPFLKVECKKGHLLNKYISRIAFTIFNISSKNLISELNDKLHESKKRQAINHKESVSAKKQKKTK